MTKARDLADFIASGTIAQTVTADGVDVGDNERIRLGDSQDLQLFHNGSASYITDSGTGNLVLQASDALIVQNGAGTENLLTAYQNGAVNLYYDNSIKLNTQANGVNVFGVVAGDTGLNVNNSSAYAYVELGGASGAYLDMKAPFSDDYDGRLQYTSNTFFLTTNADEPVQLRHNNATKLATTSTGVTVTGTVAATSFTGDGSGPTGVGFTTNVITTNTTATKDNHYYLNAASITLTLPASPSVGDEVRLSEVAGNTNCIVGRNSSNIMGAAEDLTLDTAYVVLSLRYVDATIGWAFS